MEIVAVVAVIAVICAIVGVSTGFIVTVAAAVIGLLVAAIALFFVYFFFVLVRSKPTRGTFIRIGKSEKFGFSTAFYSIDGKEYPNVFPAESFLLSKLYKKDKSYRLFLSGKKCAVFDRFALTTCIMGFICSISAVGAVILLYIKNF